MINASNLNFSENQQDNSYFYNRNEQLQPVDHLIAICDHFDINVDTINDDDFTGMCYVLEDHGTSCKEMDCFYVWLD